MVEFHTFRILIFTESVRLKSLQSTDLSGESFSFFQIFIQLKFIQVKVVNFHPFFRLTTLGIDKEFPMIKITFIFTVIDYFKSLSCGFLNSKVPLMIFEFFQTNFV